MALIFLYFSNVWTTNNFYMMICDMACLVIAHSVIYPKDQGHWGRWKCLLWYTVSKHKTDHSLSKVRKNNSRKQWLFRIDTLKWPVYNVKVTGMSIWWRTLYQNQSISVKINRLFDHYYYTAICFDMNVQHILILVTFPEGHGHS